jgi:hypothetical protein
MALALKIRSPLQKNVEGTKWYITDNTGNYEVTDNPTGWGAPNFVRSEYALLAIAHYRNEEDNEPVVFETYDPVTQTIFNLPVVRDGWIYGQLVIIPVKTGAEPDLTYVYNVADSRVEQRVDDVYIPVDEQILLTIDGLLSEEFNIPVTTFSNQKLRDTLKKIFQFRAGRITCSDDEIENMRDVVRHITETRASAHYDWCDGNEYEFMRKTHWLTAYIEDHE